MTKVDTNRRSAVPDRRSPRSLVLSRDWFIAVVLGAIAACGTWWPVLNGGALVGGDTYTYQMPQVTAADKQWQQACVPLWDDRTALGYPLHAESQAGVFYPPHLILHGLCNSEQIVRYSMLLHYLAAFVCSWRLGRAEGLRQWPALLAALIFVYGWFPVRATLGWAIIGGVWLPLEFLAAGRVASVPNARNSAVLSLVLAIHLTAGHFALAFIGMLGVVAYALLKAWFDHHSLVRQSRAAGNAPRAPAETRHLVSSPATDTDREQHPGETAPAAPNADMKDAGRKGTPLPHSSGISRVLVASVLAVAAAFPVAAVQILPTLELRSYSQRASASGLQDPAYGSIPPLYYSQLLTGTFYWHAPEVAATGLMKTLPGTFPADTNTVEAHLYFGLLPLLIMLSGLLFGGRTQTLRRWCLVWGVPGIFATVYATGWLTPLLGHLPGFSFFIGAGRYSVITALSGALLAGHAVQQFVPRKPVLECCLVLVVSVLTYPDLMASARYPVSDGQVVPEAPLRFAADSPVAERLRGEQLSRSGKPVVVFAPGPNACTLYGIRCVPAYLGLGPAPYYSSLVPPQPETDRPGAVGGENKLLSWCRGLGVTHLLTTEPAAAFERDDLDLILSEPDSYLNRLWGRGAAPVFLYRLRAPGEWLFTEPAELNQTASEPSMEVLKVERTASRIDVEVRVSGECVVSVRELMFPGWRVMVDGKSAVNQTSPNALKRSVLVTPGRHKIVWTYAPTSFYAGVLVSLLGLVAVGIVIGRGSHD